MRQINRFMTAVLAAALLLSGCGTPPEETHATLPPLTTEQDSFTIPPRADASQYYHWDDTTIPIFEVNGGSSFGVTGDLKERKDGTRYFSYTGEELCLDMIYESEGSSALREVSAMLYLDGIPQPYRLEGETEYSYLHTFRYEGEMQKGEPYFSVKEKIWLQPVTGKAGDTLVLTAINVFERDRSAKDPVRTPGFAFGSLPTERFVQFAADAPEPGWEKPPVRLSDVTTTYTPSTMKEVGLWTPEDLDQTVEYHLYINDLPVVWGDPEFDGNIYGITGEEPVRLRFEVWGSPRFTYGLTFFVNFEAVRAEGMEMIPVEIQNGQKTVVEATLDLSEYDGAATVFAAVIPRDSWGVYDHRISPEFTEKINLVDFETKEALTAFKLEQLAKAKEEGVLPWT